MQGGVRPKGLVLWEREVLPPQNVLIGHFWRGGGLGTSRVYYLGAVAGLGVSEGSQRLGAQNLDRFQPLLEGGRPLLAGGLAPTVRLGKADLGFQKGLSDWGVQNLDRFQPLLEGGRPVLAGGSGSDCSARRSRFGVSEGPQRLGGPEP